MLTSVSCTPAGLCVAVDNAGYAVMSTFSPQAVGEHDGGSHSGGSESEGEQSGGSNTSTGSSLPLTVAFPGAFRILGVKVESNGQIVLTLKAPGTGSFSALATAVTGRAAADSRKTMCRKAGRKRKVTYGTGSAMAPGPGTTTVTIKPTKSALGSLKGSHTLRVPVTIVFHPHSGSPTTLTETVIVRYQSPRCSRACSASKGVCRGKR